MRKILTAVALSIALPSLAHAQTAPAQAPAPKASCCEKMDSGKHGKMNCRKHKAGMEHGQHDGKAGVDPHAGHDMGPSGTKAPAADAPQAHQH